MDSDVLDDKQKSIVGISAFAANGDLEKLTPAFTKGLEAGLTINEIKEILVQLYAYTGFPRSLNAITTLMNVTTERQRQGIKDEVGREATPMPADLDRDAFGARTRAKIAGRATIPLPAGYQIFAPIIDTFLKEHLFADIFYRDNLDWKSRELSTISTLATIRGAEGQLCFHIGGAMNMGLTSKQMGNFVMVMHDEVGQVEGQRAADALKIVLESRD